MSAFFIFLKPKEAFFELQLSMDNVYDVIEVSEMFFLPDLKRQCGVYLTGFVEVDNAVDLIFTARLFNIPKLEQSCVEFMANNIEEVIIHCKDRRY